MSNEIPERPSHIPQNTEFCQGCQQWYDPEVCHCGEYIDKHDVGSGHSPVEYGCSCFYVDKS